MHHMSPCHIWSYRGTNEIIQIEHNIEKKIACSRVQSNTNSKIDTPLRQCCSTKPGAMNFCVVDLFIWSGSGRNGDDVCDDFAFPLDVERIILFNGCYDTLTNFARLIGRDSNSHRCLHHKIGSLHDIVHMIENILELPYHIGDSTSTSSATRRFSSATTTTTKMTPLADMWWQLQRRSWQCLLQMTHQLVTFGVSRWGRFVLQSDTAIGVGKV